MKIKKPLALAGVVSAVALASLAGTGAVSAATTSNGSPSNLIDKIAQKFNLNKDEVKAVFDQEHTAREAQQQQSVGQELSQAVTDKKITAEQKDKIISKLAELKATREAERSTLKDKTPAERHAAMEANRAELQKWASDNGIPTEYLHLGMGHGPGGKPDMNSANN